MNVLFGMAMMILADVSGGACASGQKTLTPVLIQLNGVDCQVPAKPYVHWWKNDGTRIQKPFNVTVGVVDWNKPMEVYEPSVIWLTAENASECVRGKRVQRPDGCVGVFDLPCARSLYTLTVSEPSLHVYVMRSIPRQADPDRCDHRIRFESAWKFTEGEKIGITIFTAEGHLLCQTAIDVATLGDRYIDTYDVDERRWDSETPKKSDRRSRNERRLEKEAAKKVSNRVAIELVRVGAQ